MKSREFLKEDSKQLLTIKETYGLSEEIFQLALAIKENCKQYLKENSSPVMWMPLFRGIQAKNTEIIHRSVRLTNRKPVDTPISVHNMLNQYFTETIGSPFRNAMFCTGSDIDASGYGNEFIIFPEGNFEYVWSPVIDDLWMVYQDTEKGETQEETNETFMTIVKNGKWQTTNLEDAIKSKHEIMIRCKSYYGIGYDDGIDNGNIWRGLSEILRTKNV